MVGPFQLQTEDRQMTQGISLTSREAKALLNLSQCFGSPDNMDMTNDHISVMNDKLDRGPVHDDTVRVRLQSAAVTCSLLKGKYASMDVRPDGIRIFVTSADNPCGSNTKIVGWLDIKLCKINPLTAALDRAVRELDE